MIGGAAALGAVIPGTATQAGKTKGMDRAVRRRVDEHWFDDALGGWSAGIAIAIASTAFDDSFSRETPGPGLPRP